MLTQIADTVAHAAAASTHAGMGHSMGRWSVAAGVFPYVAIGFLYLKRAILKRRYRREAELLAAAWRDE